MVSDGYFSLFSSMIMNKLICSFFCNNLTMLSHLEWKWNAEFSVLDARFQNWGIWHGVYPWISPVLVGGYSVMWCILNNRAQAKIFFLIITGDIPAVIFPNFQSWHLMHQLSSIRSGFKLVESFCCWFRKEIKLFFIIMVTQKSQHLFYRERYFEHFVLYALKKKVYLTDYKHSSHYLVWNMLMLRLFFEFHYRKTVCFLQWTNILACFDTKLWLCWISDL